MPQKFACALRFRVRKVLVLSSTCTSTHSLVNPVDLRLTITDLNQHTNIQLVSGALLRALLPTTLALPSRKLLGFCVFLFFIATSAILASTRVGSRLTSLFSQIRPVLLPAFTRPITTSTMASKGYQTPPQAPPSFTATTTSLVEDAKALCGMFTEGYGFLVLGASCWRTLLALLFHRHAL